MYYSVFPFGVDWISSCCLLALKIPLHQNNCGQFSFFCLHFLLSFVLFSPSLFWREQGAYIKYFPLHKISIKEFAGCGALKRWGWAFFLSVLGLFSDIALHTTTFGLFFFSVHRYQFLSLWYFFLYGFCSCFSIFSCPPTFFFLLFCRFCCAYYTGFWHYFWHYENKYMKNRHQ